MGPALDLTESGNIPDFSAKSSDRVSDPRGDIFASPGAEDDHILSDGFFLQLLKASPGGLSALHRAEAKNSRLWLVRSHELAVGNLVKDSQGGFFTAGTFLY